MGSAAGQYLWDVFVSYKHDPLMMPWFHRVVDIISYWLRQELGGDDVRVFFAVRSIEVGTPWPDVLRHAIRSSKCLLPFLSPDYFRSEWCFAEWSSFLERQRLLADGTSLIAPIRIHDGRWFPDDARRIQQLDACEHAHTVASYWQTVLAAELDRLLRNFATRLAEIIISAPDYRDDWPVIDPAPAPPPRHVSMRRL